MLDFARHTHLILIYEAASSCVADMQNSLSSIDSDFIWAPLSYELLDILFANIFPASAQASFDD